MSDPGQLPHLLKLVDDESERVQEAVAKALAAFGPALEQHLSELPTPPDQEQVERVRQRLRRHHSNESPSDSPQDEAGTEPRFVPGQLVRHVRYGYRGVVVAFDLTCQADDDWYFNNRSQPDRYQAWYHVLVHGAEHVTYAAQTSLEANDTGEQVVHPFVGHFFSAFSDGRYTRNDTPWPK